MNEFLTPSLKRPVRMKPTSKTMIVFATRWGAQFGGINSFNQDLVSAFAAACYEQVTTICVVLTASSKEIQSALDEHQVHLLSMNLEEQSTFSANFEPKVWESLLDTGFVIDSEHTIWLGHDRITGAIALAAAKLRGGRAALIHHMSYSRYETIAENSAMAQLKVQEQEKLFRQADILLAVGPLLRDSLIELSRKEDVAVLIPGLADIAVQPPSKTFRAFLSGRLTDDARKIKQAHLGVAAFANAIRKATDNKMPEVLLSRNQPMLTLRGVNFGGLANGDKTEAENELNEFAFKRAGRVFNLNALPFTTDRTELFDEVSRASVAMMPSWHEGFGLVAWEAIAAGVPLIISDKSGVYQLLEDLKDGLYLNAVKAIDVMGDTSDPYFQEDDVHTLTTQLMDVATDKRARNRAVCLREELLRHFTWADCAKEFATAIGWQTNLAHQTVATTLPVAQPEDTGQEVRIDGLLLPESTWHPDAGLSDSQLLRAEEAIVPFDRNREPFLDTQIEWAKGDEDIAVRLLTGLGGVGKTRLGLELCRRLKNQGWQTGFLSGECELNQVDSLVDQIVESQRNCCIVIDYAETRQPILLALLKKSLKNKNPLYSIRIMLLARAGGEWWASLPGKDAECEGLLDGPSTSGPFPVPLLHDNIGERQHAYQQALATYAERLGVKAPEHTPALNEEHFSRPLYIQMAALMTLRGERPKSAEALPRALINHEQRYWGRVLSPGSNRDEQIRQAALLMTLATLANGLFPDRQCEDIWVTINEDKSELRRLFKALTPLYSERQRLQGLRPDLIGEALVAQSLLGFKGEWLLDTVLAKGNSQLRQTTLTVLARLLRNRPDLATMVEEVLTKNFVNCVSEIVAVCIETPDKLSTIVEQAYQRLPKGKKSQATALLDSKIKFDTLPLTGLKLLICKELVKKAEEKTKLKRTQTIENYASALTDLSLALKYDGRIEDSAKPILQAIEIYKKLTPSSSPVINHNHVATLNRYANTESDLGHYEKALNACEESLTLIRKMATKYPGHHETILAETLRNYANHLSNLERHDEALKAGLEDLEIFKNTANDSDDYKFGLTKSLSNCANYLSDCGDSAQALQFGSEALKTLEQLAQNNPKNFDPELSQILSNHSCLLAKEGQINDAIDIAKRSVAMREQLVKIKPERFQEDLAGSLNNLAAHLLEKGHSAESIDTSERSLNIYKTLALARPKKFIPELAQALNNHANHLAELGLYHLAVKCSSEAVETIEKHLDPQSNQYHFQHQFFQLELFLWRWLENNNISPDEIPAPSTAKLNDRQECFLTFTRAYTQAAIRPNNINLQHAFECWNRMTPIQQHINLSSFLTIASIADFLYGRNSAPEEWRVQMTTYRKKRTESLPIWMVEIAKRIGCDLVAYLG
ncbi:MULTISPECIES: glycosyltransferase [unclassified Pseudomonas]|uniref:glycosyltransferase n=1 Tax=unclassified Pseudomonas TaxID=196821 RepID=UPI000A1E6434|nr:MULTISPECIES: glycosyltransferase [unclassified Pseudomonas]